MAITPDQLAQIDSFEAMALFCYEELQWPTDEWNVFEGVPALYGLSPQDIPGVVSLSAVQKLVASQAWGIFLVDFGGNDLKRPELRKILNAVAQKARQQHDNPTWPHDNILFICRSHGTEWSFAHYRGDALAQSKLKTFGWISPRRSRTVCNLNLPCLYWNLQYAWFKAWDVTVLTKTFFTEFDRIFKLYEPQIKLAKHQFSANLTEFPEGEQRTLVMQRTTNRLLFLAFLQQKKWLKLSQDVDPRNYLFDLYDRWKSDPHGKTFFQVLRVLFFSGLNEHRDEARAVVSNQIGTVPFLNGGLFHKELHEDEEKLEAEGVAIVPDQLFEDLLGERGLFRGTNFTAIENYDESDEDVAVDPEMLGRVFEELVTDRHDGGSYYTPRPIVAYMCQEGLRGYLENEGFDSAGIAKLIENRDASAIPHEQAKPILLALAKVRVVDPACGSGAYLVGMLHEIMETIKAVERRFEDIAPIEEYNRKLQIIQNCIYGVDLKDFAVNIARLRMWLSLSVEFKGPNPPPLPNLDFKIEAGDSILGPSPDSMGQFSMNEETIEKITRRKADFLIAQPDEQLEIEAEIRGLIKEVRESEAGTVGGDAFIWQAEFSEVFNTGDEDQNGFDIVLANPPYVRHELITAIKPSLRAIYGEFYCGTADLFTYFYARGHQLLKQGGMLVFISSNKWFRAQYGENLRLLMAAKATIRGIVDFGELPVFQSAATFPVIFLAQRSEPEVQCPNFCQVRSLGPPYPDIRELVKTGGFELPNEAIRGPEWTLADKETIARLHTMKVSGVSLYEYVNGNIYYGIKTGLNEAFVINGETRDRLIAEDPRSAEIIKPLVIGDDVRRWQITRRDRWLIFTRRGVDIDRYQAIKTHLSLWRRQLEPRPRDWDPGRQGIWPGRKPGSYKWFEIQDEIAYHAQFDQPKIVYSEISMETRFTLDWEGVYLSNTAYILGVCDLYLLGTLNSNAFWFYMANTAAVVGNVDERGRIRMTKQYVEKVPIPLASDADRAAIDSRVQQILGLKAADPSADVSELEAEIDKRVEFLYFHQSEAPTYDVWLAKYEAEKGTIVEEIRELLSRKEDQTLEYKSSVIWNVKADKHDLVMRDEVLKEICAFLNADGGTILCGVEENPDGTGRIVGLAKDVKHQGNSEKLGRVVTNALGDLLQPDPAELVRIMFIEIDGSEILRIIVGSDAKNMYQSPAIPKGNQPGGKPTTHVRVNGEAKAFDGQALINWWKRREAGLPIPVDAEAVPEAIDPWKLDLMALDYNTFIADPFFLAKKAEGWEFIGAGTEFGKYVAKGYEPVVWRSPDGKLWRLGQSDGGLWMMRKTGEV